MPGSMPQRPPQTLHGVWYNPVWEVVVQQQSGDSALGVSDIAWLQLHMLSRPYLKDKPSYNSHSPQNAGVRFCTSNGAEVPLHDIATATGDPLCERLFSQLRVWRPDTSRGQQGAWEVLNGKLRVRAPHLP